ncbi:MAG TPA: hypothetical protein EYP85_00830 [Armatimonadetes bacterium]|nr:hypothetical protein [Armatimonadota bacterium]
MAPDKTVSYHYDAGMDGLYVWLRQPPAVVCVEPEDGIAIRIDACTDEFVGYTIVDFCRRFPDRNPAEIRIPLAPQFALAPICAILAGEQAEVVSSAAP